MQKKKKKKKKKMPTIVIMFVMLVGFEGKSYFFLQPFFSEY